MVRLWLVSVVSWWWTFGLIASFSVQTRAAEQGTAGSESAGLVETTVDGRVFRIPPGFTLQRVSTAEQLPRPIVADFDPTGHLFVADSSGSNDDVQTQLQLAPHRIVRLTDDDEDGVYDRSVVFADRMMFPEGVLCHAGSVFVSAPPVIWRLTDDNGDGVCDRREVWFDGRTLTGCANDLHGPYLGPDGWIYWCKGAFAEQTYERAGGANWSTRAAHIFRKPLNGGPIEPVMTGGMDNPVEVAFLPSGERFFTTTFLQHPGGGRRDGLIHAIYGGVYGKSHAVLDGHPRTGELMPPLVHLGPAAPSGLTCLKSDDLGTGFRDALVATCFNLHQVSLHRLVAEGASFRTEDRTLVATEDLDFHPTDVLEDADGSLLILDTGGWYKLCCPTSQLHKPDVLGAIYRLRRNAGSNVADPRGRRVPWDQLTAAQRVERLGDERPWVRRRAVEWIEQLEEASDTIVALDRVLAEQTDERWRTEAVWALTRRSEPAARVAVRRGLTDRSPVVRTAALHSISVHRDREAAQEIAPLLTDPSLAVRRAAAEAAGRLADPALLPPLVSALSAPECQSDRILQHSLIYALWETADTEELRRLLATAPDAAQGGILMALDQLPQGKLMAEQVLAAVPSSSPSTQRAAAWILGHHPEWGAAVVRQLTRWHSTPGTTSIPLTLQEDLLAGSLADESAQLALAVWLGDEASRVKQEFIWRAVQRAHVEHLAAPLQAAIAKQLSRGEAEVEEAILRCLAGGRAALDEPTLQQTLRHLVDDPNRSVTRRLQAAAVQAEGATLEEALFELLLAQSLDENLEPGVRGLAVSTLTRAQLSVHQAEVLVERLPAAGPVELGGLLLAFRNLPDGPLSQKLIHTLCAAPALAVLPPATLRDALGHFSAETRRPLDESLAKLHAEVANQPQRLADLLARLPEGDLRRGQTVFHSTKAACFSCHEMGYRGGDIGPDLTRIGNIRSKRDLLEAIVFPSASFVRSFEPQTVVMADGTIHQGVMRDDQPHQLVLVTDQRQRIEIPREQIEEIRPSRVSIMPSGLDQLLSEQELADLITFLEAAK